MFSKRKSLKSIIRKSAAALTVAGVLLANTAISGFAAEIGTVTASRLNVRDSASYYGAIIDIINRNDKVTPIGWVDGWLEINYNGADAYVRSEYIYVTDDSVQESQSVSQGQSVVDFAMSFIGTPYAYGGASPSGFDCSGFCYYVFSHFGKTLSRTSYAQAGEGMYVGINELQPGDLVGFSNSPGGRSCDHVGIYIGDGKMIHAPYSGRTVCVENATSGWFGARYVTGRRILY